MNFFINAPNPACSLLMKLLKTLTRIIIIIMFILQRVQYLKAIDHLQGGDLFDTITQSTKFVEPDAARMVSDMTQALFYLHSLNIVHRDLKPENVLVSDYLFYAYSRIGAVIRVVGERIPEPVFRFFIRLS